MENKSKKLKMYQAGDQLIAAYSMEMAQEMMDHYGGNRDYPLVELPMRKRINHKSFDSLPRKMATPRGFFRKWSTPVFFENEGDSLEYNG